MKKFLIKSLFFINLLTLCSVSLVAFSENTDLNTFGKWVQWNPHSEVGSLILTKALFNLRKSFPELVQIQGASPNNLDEITRGFCLANIFKPSQTLGSLVLDDIKSQFPVIKNDKNQIVCDYELSFNKTGGTIILDLSSIKISRWGGSLYPPKGLSFKGEVAERLYEAFAEIYKNFSFSEFFTYNEQVLKTPEGHDDYLDYRLNVKIQYQYEQELISMMECVKYYFYPPDAPRPQIPRWTMCILIHDSEE